MNRIDVPLYSLDLTGESPFNRVTREEGVRSSNQLVIPNAAPFYIDSVTITHVDGTPMDLGKDYDFYGILANLTEYTAKSVGLYIRFLNDDIKEWIVSYNTVGNFNKITTEILNMLKAITEDDRPVHWDNIDNKPLWFVPELHQHDYTFHFFGFSDLARELLRVQQYSALFNDGVQTDLDMFNMRLESYISEYQGVLNRLITRHDTSKADPHGVWKTDIGLDNVDNFKTATLQETLEGLRDDLHITVNNAAQAIEITKVSNERLFPAGTLPLLRYGNDSFIPPKIDGSFEGMGGYNFRLGVVRESSGEMVALQHRNDGVVRGLYFLKCDDPYAKNPNWSYTSYRYIHPTAVADGANIDSVINGSGQYVLVIGDSVKGIWYWCETNGTLDPSKHVLKRISGDFINVNHGMGQSLTLLVDSDYADQWFIMGSMTNSEVKAARPDYPTSVETGGGDRSVEAMRFFSCIASSTAVNLCTVDFKEQDGKTPKDKIWMPYTRTVVSPNTITGYEAEYETPAITVWNYRGIQGMCKRTAVQREYAFRLYNYIYRIEKTTGLASGSRPVWKGTLKLDPVTNTVKVLPGPGEKRYRISIKPNDDTGVENDLFVNWKTSSLATLTDDVSRGYAEFDHNGNAIYVSPVVSGSLPGQVTLYKTDAPLTPERLIGARSDFDYVEVSKTPMPEVNPAGLAVGLTEPMSILGDTNRPETAIVLGTQLSMENGEIKIEWVGRPTPFMNPDWTGNTSLLQPITIGGVQVKGYPLTPETYTCSMGPYKFWSLHGFSVIPEVSSSVRERWTRSCGADGMANINGTPTSQTDFLFPKICRHEIVGREVRIIPVEVYNVESMLSGQIKTYLDGKGINTETIKMTWTMSPIYNRKGEERVLLMVSSRKPGDGLRDVEAIVMVGQLKGVGNPITKDGYKYYEHSTFDFGDKHHVGPALAAPSTGLAPGGPIHAWRAGFCVADINTGTTPGSADQTCIYLRTIHRYTIVGDTVPINLLIEMGNDFSITRSAVKPTGSSPYSASICASPGNTMGYISSNDVNLARGACVVAGGLRWGTSRFDILASADPGAGVEKRLLISNLLVSAFTVYFQAADNVLLGGRAYDVKATYIDIRDFDSNPANKTFYIYLRFAGGQPTYQIERAPTPETATSACVAVVKTGATRIETVVPYNRFLMNGVEISSKRRGAAILSPAGSIFDKGSLAPIISESDFLPG
ncbi:hypothetical protein D6_0117 [Aeromonas phage D6]|uniref:Tail fiber protein n=1 Tax=Aeromonas phage D6 TaxID=2593322 RepID=A0A514TW66_9CAUD|nr:virion structural protein [Aeromonas phage D6]QDJ97277.1 hypothetical protein D6_0117 [Aeromonas phage D6]